jgi:hypothetical protein
MTGELKVHQTTSEAITVTQDGVIDTFVVWASGAVVADQVKVTQTTPGNDDNLTSKLYVDTEIAANSGGGGGSFDGGEINEDLILKSDNRWIDSSVGVAGSLAYAGVPKFKWGSTKNVSEQDLRMAGNRITEVADIDGESADSDAVNLGSMNTAIGPSVLGRAFEYDGEEDSWFRIDAQKFGIFDATTQLTGSLSAAKYLVVHQDDKDGFAFHTAGLNISTMHAGTISLLTTAGRYLGAWSLDEWGTNGFTGSSSAGKYVVSIALGEWKGASTASISTGTTYRLSSSLWGK